MVSFPYHSHTTPIRIPKYMGMVWEAYHKGVPFFEMGGPAVVLKKHRNIWSLFHSYVLCLPGFLGVS